MKKVWISLALAFVAYNFLILQFVWYRDVPPVSPDNRFSDPTALQSLRSADKNVKSVRSTERAEDFRLNDDDVNDFKQEATQLHSSSSIPSTFTEETKRTLPVPSHTATTESSLLFPDVYDTWSKYASSEFERSCEGDFGLYLATRWREQKRTYCEPLNSGSLPAWWQSDSGTTVTSYQLHQTRHSGPDNLIVVENLMFDFNKIGGNDRWFDFERGALSGLCRKDRSLWDDRAFPAMMHAIFESFEDVTEPAKECSAWVEHPVYFVSRDGELNLYHSSEDFVNAFLALVILQQPVDDLQVTILDRDPFGPYLPIWEKAYSPNHPVFRADKLSQANYDGEHSKYHSKDGKQYNGAVCFKKAIFSIVGPGSPICKDIGRPNECTDASLLKGYARFLLEGFGLWDLGFNLNPIRVTLISRKDYPHRTVVRKFGNEFELTQLIQQTHGVELKVVNFAELSFEEQLRTVRQTHILIGVHGAGLMHLAFMPKEAVVIEVFHPGGEVNKHFRNLAKWTDKVYLPVMNNGGSEMAVDVNMRDFTEAFTAAVRIARNFLEGHSGCGLQC